MPPFLRFLIVRFLSIPVTMLIVTMTLYGFVMLTPAEQRAELYFKGNAPEHILTPERRLEMMERIIESHHLRDPYPVQYAYWLGRLVRGDWGWSPVLTDEVLPALLRRTPVTAELTIYSLLLFLPLGLVSGMLAGWKKNSKGDRRFRAAAFIATSIPMFILALVLLDVFYVALHWFPPERLSIINDLAYKSDSFRAYTGLVTLDGLLNGRPDITLDGLRHLVLPVITLSLFHWATIGMVSRSSLIEESHKDYLMAARARGIPEKQLLWGHAYRNVLAPTLTSTALSVAWLVTGIYVVEVIFNFHGISDVGTQSVIGIPDAPAILGFAIYSVLLVSIVMFALDIIQAIFDPRIRQGLTQ